MLKKIKIRLIQIFSVFFILAICSYFITLYFFSYPIHMIPAPQSEIVKIEYIFKDAGVLSNPKNKYGISAVVSKLLFRKINGLSKAETEEYLMLSGITSLDVSSFNEDFKISVSIVKSQLKSALDFLLKAFHPNYSENDLIYAKNCFPILVSQEHSTPQEILKEAIYANLYPTHNYGKNPTGTMQSISTITLADINDFFVKNFTTDKLQMYCTYNKIKIYNKNNLFLYLINKIYNKCLEITESLSLRIYLMNHFKSHSFSSFIKSIFQPQTLKKISINKSSEVETITNNNMRDIVGICIGMRFDNLSQTERAGLLILCYHLFNSIDGTLITGCKIPVYHFYEIANRKLSSTALLTIFLNKKDLKNYINYLREFFNKKHENFDNTKIFYKALQQKKLISFSSLQEQNGFYNLSFDKCTDTTYLKLLNKIKNKDYRKVVYIWDNPEQVPNQ